MVTSDFWSKVEICAMKKYAIGPYLWPNRQNSFILWEITVGEHDDNVIFLTESRNIGVSRMRNVKYAIWPLLMAIAIISESRSKYGSGNIMVASDFWPEVEVWPFRACAMKNIKFGPYVWPNSQNSFILYEIGVGGTVQPWTCEPYYGADTMFYRTYFLW